MISNIYVRIKQFIKNNYKTLLLGVILVFLCFYELPYVIYTPGGIVTLEKRINVENKYETAGSISMSYVSMMRGKIPLVLASFIIPDWDLKKESDVTIQDGSVDDLLKLEKLYMQSSIDNATFVAYRAAEKELIITKNVNNVTYISEKSETDLKVYDVILKADGQVINDIQDLKNVVRNHNEGEEIELTVLSGGSEKIKHAKVFKQNDLLYIGVSFLTTYEYETNPKIDVKTKRSESGSSGGLMLSLAIYNAITEEDITRGRKIIGTGTIDSSGNVGTIDGIKYKLLGAEKNKGDIFLCPIANYEEALKVKEKYNLKIELYAVNTFEEALEVLKK